MSGVEKPALLDGARLAIDPAAPAARNTLRARDTRALTGIRGVAALGVMAFHFTRAWTPLGCAAHLLSKGYLAVDLFFLLSGFVIAMNDGARFAAGAPFRLCLPFYRRRIERVYPLFLAVTVLFCVYRILTGAFTYSVLDILANVAMVHQWFGLQAIVGPSWSVSLELMAYLLFPWIAAFVFRRRSWVALLAIATAWTCLSWFSTVLANGYGPLNIADADSFFPLVRCLCGFVVGVCAYRLAITRHGRVAIAARGLPEVVLAVLLVFASFTDWDVAMVALFVPLIGCLAVPDHLLSRTLRSRAAMRLGDLSYAIYLTHVCVGTIVVKAGIGPPWLLMSVSFVMTLIVASMLHDHVERPIRVFLKSGGLAKFPDVSTEIRRAAHGPDHPMPTSG